jgi:uncharacterized PurR-regulated membrane protein YhhQ (DUF165 family)
VIAVTAKAYLLGYIASIVLANVATSKLGLVTVVGLTVTAGTFLAGAALVLRDGVQNASGKRIVMFAIAVGALVSAATSSPALAVASGLAFLVSEFVDFAVYTPLRERSLSAAVIASSVAAAPVDTVLFLHLAGFGVTAQAVAGQFVIKTAIAGATALGLSWRST